MFHSFSIHFPFIFHNPHHYMVTSTFAEVGDCLGGLQFTHLAGYQGALSAFNALQGVQLKGPKLAEALMQFDDLVRGKSNP